MTPESRETNVKCLICNKKGWKQPFFR